ncbi:sulfur carrier protein CysO [archaeon BMS3Abin16]|nr:sulfur carrier protein CysO [archaeon BMS3Abin16]HDY73526.1 molybdopterin synthase sulfur carrier subunit [Euryarchaeota archaeon]
MALVRLSTPLRRFTDGKPEVEAEGVVLSELLADLNTRFPGIGEKILKDGEIQRFVNVYVDNEDVRLGDGLETKLTKTSIVSILPAVSGG